jgi:hypothetical protein
MRKLPKLVYQDISTNVCTIDENKLAETFSKDSYHIMRFKVGYVGGKKNPLNLITFYNSKTGEIIPDNNAKNFSLLINQKHQEHILRVYCLDLSLIEKFKEYFNYEDTLL